MKWIDLGLPSGNLWAVENEEGFYNYKDAIEKFGYSLPTKSDFEELLTNTWIKWRPFQGVSLIAENGQKLMLPVRGYDKEYDFWYMNDCAYWTCTPCNYDEELAFYVNVMSSGPRMLKYLIHETELKGVLSVRLVKRKEQK